MTIYSQKRISNDVLRKEVYIPYLPLRIEIKINKGKYVYYVSLL